MAGRWRCSAPANLPMRSRYYVRAAAAHTQAGSSDLAAASAIALSVIHLERGEAALANGWIARAQDLIAADSGLTDGRDRFPGCRRVSPCSKAICGARLELAQAAYDLGRERGDVQD